MWKYVNSKRKCKADIGEIKSVDEAGNDVYVTEDKDKAELFFGNFFSSVFTVEDLEDFHTLDNKLVNYSNSCLLYTSDAADE